jgi:putative heme-binding domain-containing protein
MTAYGRAVISLVALILLSVLAGRGLAQDKKNDPKLIGPETEKRFPPLTVPDGFKATLFACDPLVEYPSVIALGPRERTLFVAHDYVTGLGVKIIRRDEVRLIEDTNNDGYADRSTVFAAGFNSIQGLAFYDDTVFVMHAPFLTSLKDTDKDGIADRRRDLISGIGLKPEDNSNRLHCANGVTAGHDGWLYLSLGDRGCDVKRPEGDRLVFRQGGILRCRHDGTDLHVFSTGLRNIYDVALDDELNVFVRDNENDGGDYMIRVCHCFFGSDHGYPYHYYERPDEAMKPLADLGRGSSAGGTSYLETQFPVEFQQSLFFCEWGRAIVRYPKSRLSSSFAEMKEIDFAAGAANDPYGFKPTDLVVDRDGSLLISDWCDGQRPKRGRGRIYRVSYIGNKQPTTNKKTSADQPPTDSAGLISQLNSTSYHQCVAAQLALQKQPKMVDEVIREFAQLNTHGQLHAIWIIAKQRDVDALFKLAESTKNSQIKTQAIRALGDLLDPVFVNHKLGIQRGDPELAAKIARLAEGSDPRVVLEAVSVLGRLRWVGFANWLANKKLPNDPAIDHAIPHALRQSQNWRDVLKLLDASPRLHRLALQSMAEQRDPYLAVQLIQRLKSDKKPAHRADYAEALARIVRELPPWTYWGFRPLPRVAANVDWKVTSIIEKTLDEALADQDHNVRARALTHMRREGVEVKTMRLADWLAEKTTAEHASLLCDALIASQQPDALPVLKQAVLSKKLPTVNRIQAWQAVSKNTKTEDGKQLIELAMKLDGDLLAAAFRDFGNRPKLDVDKLLESRLFYALPQVREEALRALGKRRTLSAKVHVRHLIGAKQHGIRLAAAEAAGPLGATDVIDNLLQLAKGTDLAHAKASLTSLRQLKSDKAVPAAVRALDSPATLLVGLRYLRDFGNPKLTDQIVRTAKSQLAVDIQAETLQVLASWIDRYPKAQPQLTKAIAELQGNSGVLTYWNVTGPLTETDAAKIRQQHLDGASSTDISSQTIGGKLTLKRAADSKGSVWILSTPVVVSAKSNIELLGSASGSLSVWINEKRVHHRVNSAKFRQDSDRIPTTLKKGMNRLFVEISSTEKAPQFQLRFRLRSSKAEHERLVKFALTSRGNVNRGREVFEKIDKSLCLQCHRLGKEGGKIGPDLTGIGSRFSRIHLIESILQPSRTVAPSYATKIVILNKGRSLSGIKVSETADSLFLGDNQGKIHEIAKSDIDEIVSQKLSTMPEGLEKKLTDREFVDLLLFLESQKGNRQD